MNEYSPTTELSVSFLTWVNAELRQQAKRQEEAEWNRRWSVRAKSALYSVSAMGCLALARLSQMNRVLLFG